MCIVFEDSLSKKPYMAEIIFASVSLENGTIEFIAKDNSEIVFTYRPEIEYNEYPEEECDEWGHPLAQYRHSAKNNVVYKQSEHELDLIYDSNKIFKSLGTTGYYYLRASKFSYLKNKVKNTLGNINQTGEF